MKKVKLFSRVLIHNFLRMSGKISFIMLLIIIMTSCNCHFKRVSKYSKFKQKIDNENYEGLAWSDLKIKSTKLFGNDYYFQLKIKSHIDLYSNQRIFQKTIRLRDFKKDFERMDLQNLEGGSISLDSVSNKMIYLTFNYLGIKKDSSKIDFPISISCKFNPIISEHKRIPEN